METLIGIILFLAFIYFLSAGISTLFIVVFSAIWVGILYLASGVWYLLRNIWALIIKGTIYLDYIAASYPQINPFIAWTIFGILLGITIGFFRATKGLKRSYKRTKIILICFFISALGVSSYISLAYVNDVKSNFYGRIGKTKEEKDKILESLSRHWMQKIMGTKKGYQLSYKDDALFINNKLSGETDNYKTFDKFDNALNSESSQYEIVESSLRVELGSDNKAVVKNDLCKIVNHDSGDFSQALLYMKKVEIKFQEHSEAWALTSLSISPQKIFDIRLPKNLNLRSKASINGHRITTLEKGTNFTVYGFANKWLYGKPRNSQKIGWVYSPDLRIDKQGVPSIVSEYYERIN